MNGLSKPTAIAFAIGVWSRRAPVAPASPASPALRSTSRSACGRCVGRHLHGVAEEQLANAALAEERRRPCARPRRSREWRAGCSAPRDRRGVPRRATRSGRAGRGWPWREAGRGKREAVTERLAQVASRPYGAPLPIVSRARDFPLAACSLPRPLRNPLERLLQVRQQVADVLHAARQPNQPVAHPMAARRSGGTDACVIPAGWLISDSTPPSDSASEKTRTRPSTWAARSLRPELDADHAAEAGHLPPRQLVLRVRRQPDVDTRSRRPTCSTSHFAISRPFASCWRMRRCSVFVPRSASQASNGPGDGAGGVVDELQSLGRARRRARRRSRRSCRCGRSGTSWSSGRRCRRPARAAAGSTATRTCCRRSAARCARCAISRHGRDVGEAHERIASASRRARARVAGVIASATRCGSRVST